MSAQSHRLAQVYSATHLQRANDADGADRGARPAHLAPEKKPRGRGGRRRAHVGTKEPARERAEVERVAALRLPAACQPAAISAAAARWCRRGKEEGRKVWNTATCRQLQHPNLHNNRG